MVDDRRDVLVVLSVADLVDSDVTQMLEGVAHFLALAANEASDDFSDGAPRDAHEGGDGGLVGLLSVVGNEPLHRQGVAACRLCPRNLLDEHAALLAADATEPVAKNCLDSRQVDVTPASNAGVVDALSLLPAAAAARDLPSRGNLHDQSVVPEFEVDDASLVESKEGSEYTGRAHAGWVGRGRCCNPKATPSPAAHFFTPANPLPSLSPPAVPSNSFSGRPLNRQESPKSGTERTSPEAGGGVCFSRFRLIPLCVPPTLRPMNHKECDNKVYVGAASRLVGWSAGALLTFAACGAFPIDDDDGLMGAATDGATGGSDPGEPGRGWSFECQNASNAPNYYSRWVTGPGACPAGPTGATPVSCFQQEVPSEIDVCVNSYNTNGGFDPADWTSYESGIRGVCTDRCLQQHGVGGISVEPDDNPKCDASDWSSVNPAHLNGPDVSGSECDIVDYSSLELDPTGSTIVWPDQSSAATHCDLDDDCVDQFNGLIAPWVSKVFPVQDIAPDTRRADHLATSSTSSVTLSSSAGTYVIPVGASIEYSVSVCTSSACPFYLANLEGTQSGGGVAIEIPHDGKVLKKKVTNLEFDLMHSALGSHHQSGDWIAMMQGTVTVQVKFTLTNTDGNAVGDGSFTKTLTNDSADIFGDRTASGVDSLFVQRELIPGVVATIALDDANDVDGPPSVSSTLPSIVRCASPATEADLSAYISASDPDADLDIVGWLIDDVSVFATDAGFVDGTYSIAPIAFDKRGAVDVGVTNTLTVADCP